MNVLSVTPSITGGMHTRTQLMSGKIELVPALLTSSYPGDWDHAGAPPTLDGDTATIDNTDSSVRSITKIIDVHQSVATPVTLRAKITGEGIEGPQADNFSIWFVGTYTPEGMGTYTGPTTGVEVQPQFPPGSWPETQFVARLVPTQPITYLYCYVHARSKKGRIIVRDIEVFPDTGVAGHSGEWISDPVDMAQISTQPLATGSGGIAPKHAVFYYGDVASVDNFNSIEHSKEVLSGFDIIVCREPGELSARQLSVVEYLIGLGKDVYGYTHLGGNGEIPALIDAQLYAVADRCDTNGYTGIFHDMSGYDWGVSRARLNTHVTYAHGKGLKVMSNAWTPADVLSSAVDATYNPAGTPTTLTSGDWVLLESFFTRGDGEYAGESDNFASSMSKYTQTRELAQALGVNVVVLAYHRDSVPLSDVSDRDASYLLASILGAGAWSYGHTSSDNLVQWRGKPSLYLGQHWSSGLEQVSPKRWERRSESILVWYEATDSPLSRSSGRLPLSWPTIKPTIDMSLFTGVRKSVSWEMSSSITGPWSDWNGMASERAIRARVRLES